MNKFNLPMFLLAILVVSMFVCVGAALSYQNPWLATLCVILGFGFMALGLTIKRKKGNSY